MANRVFQNVVYQMKDAVDRVVGVIDETGTVISCSELGQIGEVREGVAAVRQTAGVLLIFITNMAQYAIKGYAVGALDYVLKPVPYFAFSQQLQKAAGQLPQAQKL